MANNGCSLTAPAAEKTALRGVQSASGRLWNIDCQTLAIVANLPLFSQAALTVFPTLSARCNQLLQQALKRLTLLRRRAEKSN